MKYGNWFRDAILSTRALFNGASSPMRGVVLSILFFALIVGGAPGMAEDEVNLGDVITVIGKYIPVPKLEITQPPTRPLSSCEWVGRGRVQMLRGSWDSGLRRRSRRRRAVESAEDR